MNGRRCGSVVAYGIAAYGISAMSWGCANEVYYVYPSGSGGAGDMSSADASTSTGSDASQSSSGGDANATAGSPASSTGSGEPTGPISSACQAVCSSVAVCAGGTDPSACIAGCESVPPDCKTQHQAWLDCLVASDFPASVGCPVVSACEYLFWPYLLCRGGCEGGSCGGSPSGSCGCTAKCSVGFFETNCFPTEPGIMACQCKESGVVVGNCFGPSDPKACDPARSCCSSVLFADG